jgi:hypothetical protein
MLATIAILLVGLTAAVLVFAATRPDTFEVRRTALVQAPPQAIFPLIDDLKRWEAWSPWEKKDPGMKRVYGAVTRGVGAEYAWDGDKNVGQGSLRILESVPPNRVGMQLDFVRPFDAHNRVEFDLAPADAATRVTWSMRGGVPYFAKILHLFVDMDRMVGKDFEAGLSNLKAAAEANAPRLAAAEGSP